MRTLAFTLLLFWGTTAFAQNILIKDIQFSQGQQFTQLSEDSFRYIYQMRSRDINRSLLRKIDFNARLQMLDTTLIEIKGKYELLATTSNRTHIVTILGTHSTSGLLIQFIDNNTGAQSSYPLQLRGGWKRRNPISIYSSSQSSNIFLLNKVDARTWVLQHIGLNGKSIWSRTFSDSKKIQLTNVNLLEGNKIAFVKVTHPLSRKAKNEIIVMDGVTGKDVYTHKLYDENSKSTVDNVLVRDSVVYIAGRKFFTNRVSHQKTGLSYLRQIEDQQTTDLKLTSSLLSLKTYWMDVVINDRGERYLIGETFTNESQGAYIMKGVATGLMTLGLFYVTWTSMKFKQVAVVPLDNSEAPPLSLIQLAPRRVQLGYYTPAYPFAAYAYNTGQIRYWGHDAKSNLILQDGGLLKRYNLSTNKTDELGSLPDGSSSLVVHTAEDYVIFLNIRKGNSLVEFKAIPLNK